MQLADCIDRIVYRIDASMHVRCARPPSCCASPVRGGALDVRFPAEPDPVTQGSDRRHRHLSIE
ncbi:hypothetical protein DIE01_29460 [Burkholderia sp. Bp8990]|nr:hypothetical protein DIE01_29460 [Burkholderia sp. Bp8990]